MPLTASSGVWRIGASVLPLSQGIAFETALYELRGLAPYPLPSFGTVAASALELARGLGAREILFAGLDLVHDDLRSHARPNVFDRFLADRTDRLSPLHHRRFGRQAAMAAQANERGTRRRYSSAALDTYAGWFAALESSSVLRLMRLLPTKVNLPSLHGLDADEFRAYVRALAPLPARVRTRPQRSTPGSAEERRLRAGELLRRWAGELEDLHRLPGELLSRPVLASLCFYTDAVVFGEALSLIRRKEESEAEARIRKLALETASLLDTIRSAIGEEAK
jgi:hypothetical protein